LSAISAPGAEIVEEQNCHPTARMATTSFTSAASLGGEVPLNEQNGRSRPAARVHVKDAPRLSGKTCMPRIKYRSVGEARKLCSVHATIMHGACEKSRGAARRTGPLRFHRKPPASGGMPATKRSGRHAPRRRLSHPMLRNKAA